ncbi:MAG: transcriptional regulator, TetR family [Proteobacteria bacterium]|nr:transcriptional regulator, TetR family [Pseudomonadota bacterium]
MNSTSQDLPSEQPRAELRKIQVLDAATECFRKNGFHNTSMLQISKAARMSVGHIYHYFENKEAIISAIVDRELQSLQSILLRIRDRSAGGDLLRAAAAEAQYAVDEILHDQNAPLILEIIAEAARNPSVAAIVQESDQQGMSYFKALIEDGLRLRGLDFNESDLDGPLEVLYAVFEGFSIRAIRNPKMNIVAVVSALHRTLEFIIEELIAKSPVVSAKG